MAPPSGRVTRADKSKTPKAGSGSKSVQKKKKVRCSKCTDIHIPPTGRNCNRQPPRQNLTSTILQDPEVEPEVTNHASPTMSPVRTEGIHPNLLAGHLHAVPNNMPSLQQQMDAANRMSQAFRGYTPPVGPQGNTLPSQQSPYLASMSEPGLTGQNTPYLAPPPYVSPLAQVSSAPAAVYGPRPTMSQIPMSRISLLQLTS